MRLEHRHNGRTDIDLLLRIAEQVSDHANASRLRQLDQRKDVSAAVAQGGMHRMPGARPAVDAAARLNRLPADVERAAGMAQPLRPPLPAAARIAPLHFEYAFGEAVPVGLVQAIALGLWRRKTGGEISLAHCSVSAEP